MTFLDYCTRDEYDILDSDEFNILGFVTNLQYENNVINQWLINTLETITIVWKKNLLDLIVWIISSNLSLFIKHLRFIQTIWGYG